ncbi:MAG: hypothetical protein HYV93_00615 [Candidatus Rokubacteria bacterium]|nr:hypothetical protein [Candidatus Rokubacteria bacterium]
MNLKEHVRIRIREAGKPKVSSERRVGDHFERKTGRWLRIDWLIDWANDWYSKRITDPETGEEVYRQEHRLSEHRGRGSARTRAARAPADTNAGT